jgi:hypothetical protein
MSIAALPYLASTDTYTEYILKKAINQSGLTALNTNGYFVIKYCYCQWAYDTKGKKHRHGFWKTV